MSENELKIEIYNILEYSSLSSLKSTIENYKNIIITSIYFIIEQESDSQLYSCKTESDFLSYKSYLQQQSSNIGKFLFTYSHTQPLDFQILQVSGTPDLAYVKVDSIISKTWVLKSKFSFKLVCVEGELEGIEIEPDLIGDDVYQINFSLVAGGPPRLLNLFFKAKSLDNLAFGPMLWVSLVII